MFRPPPRSTLFPYTTLFRSDPTAPLRGGPGSDWSRLLAPLPFPTPPPARILQIERIPALIDRPHLSSQYRVAGNSSRQWHQIAETVEHRTAVALGTARQQMPQGQPVARAGGGQEAAQRAWLAAFEAFHSAAQAFRGVLEIGNPRTAPLARHAGGAGGNEGLAIARLERHPPHRYVQYSVPFFVDREGVLT